MTKIQIGQTNTGDVIWNDGTVTPPMSMARPSTTDISNLPLSKFTGPRKVTIGTTDSYQTVPSQQTAGYIRGEEISPLAQKRAVQTVPESVKRDLWDKAGLTKENFDINAFDKDPTGQVYIKADYIEKNKPKPLNLFDISLPTAKATPEVIQSTQPEYTPPTKGFFESIGNDIISSNLAQDIVNAKPSSELLSDVSTQIKNAGYADNEGVKQKQESFVSDMISKGYEKDAIFSALDTLQKQGAFQGGITENPITGTLASLATMPLQAGATALQGAEDIGHGLPKAILGTPSEQEAGLTQMVKGGTKVGLGALQLGTSATPAGYAVNTALGSDTAGNIIQPAIQGIQDVTASAQKSLGYDPNSEASKNIQETTGMVAPIGATALAGKYVSPKVGKAGTAIKDTALSPIETTKSALEPFQTSKEFVPAQTKSGVNFDVEKTPGLTTNLSDKFAGKSNEILAQQSVFPKATKEKSLQARQNSSKTALEGIEQLHEDKAKGIVTSDIKTMQGGVDGISEALDHYGKQIGDLTKSDVVVPTLDLITKLKKSSEAPFSGISAGMKSTVDNIVNEFEKVGNNATISDLQTALSNIKSEIFSNHENVAKLYKTNTGKALNEFLKDLETRFDSTIENTSGNSALLKQNKSAYSKYKKIQKDLTDSLMVELRNQGKGVTGTAGKIAGLYEVLSNPTISGIMKAVALKQAGEFMQYYKSRSGNYETLIRNLDREAIKRVSNPKKSTNGRNNSTTGGNMDNSVTVNNATKPSTQTPIKKSVQKYIKQNKPK